MQELLGNISLLWSEETLQILLTINISSLRDWEKFVLGNFVLEID
jgi:hypothetical protein